MAYTITDTAQSTKLSGRGEPKEVWRVWIRTERGTTGVIEVDPANWSAEKLKPVLTAFAAKLDLAFTLNDTV